MENRILSECDWASYIYMFGLRLELGAQYTDIICTLEKVNSFSQSKNKLL